MCDLPFSFPAIGKPHHLHWIYQGTYSIQGPVGAGLTPDSMLKKVLSACYVLASPYNVFPIQQKCCLRKDIVLEPDLGLSPGSALIVSPARTLSEFLWSSACFFFKSKLAFHLRCGDTCESGPAGGVRETSEYISLLLVVMALDTQASVQVWQEGGLHTPCIFCPLKHWR